jgi:hypothetical protein
VLLRTILCSAALNSHFQCGLATPTFQKQQYTAAAALTVLALTFIKGVSVVDGSSSLL